MKRCSKVVPLLALLYTIGCATQRAGLPEINDAPRRGLNLVKPVIFSVLDARINKEKSRETLARIRDGLTHVYRNSLE